MAESQNEEAEIVDFETAISECGFGLFNVWIMASAIPCLSAMVFSASTMSYVMPTAECDLKLSVMDKGVMYAVTYAGMIISAVPWGFMSDTMGRRVVLITGGWIDGICVLCSALSQNAMQLMIFKFFDGFVICGPFAVVVSYLAEFHGKRHRPYIMFFIGVSVSLGALSVPMMAYFLLPLRIVYNISHYRFRTWQIFVALSSVPSFLSGFLHIFLPESPKFLMSQGYYGKALHCFQRIYSINKCKSRDSFPIKTLAKNSSANDDPLDNRGRLSRKECLRRTKIKFYDGLQNMKPLCAPPYLGMSLRLYALHFCQIMCVNSVRLWLPQIFATMHAFEVEGVRDLSMCAVLEYNMASRNGSRTTRKECDLHQSRDSFIDTIIVAGVGLIGFLIIFPLLRIRFVADHILKVSLFVCTFLVVGLYFSNSILSTLLVCSIYLTIMGICATTIIGMCVAVFPTLMRTMVVLLIMTFGRFGSVTGNILLPFFIKLNCWAPFLWLSLLMLTAFIFSLSLKINMRQSLA